jgi:arylsulfatase A-like enzyme/Tfp pilus assembly protein PilF
VIRSKSIAAACVVLALLGLAVLSLASAKASPALPHPNVILITMDTLRADHVGCYGAKQVQTPTLDALAQDGIVFDRAIAQVPLTWPSHAAILTGTYPFQNGVQDFTGHPLDSKFRSIAQAFRQAGYSTGAVVSSFVLDRSWGLSRGFDFYDDAFSANAFQQKDLGLVDRKAGESVTHAMQWLARTPRRPFFLWLHLYDPHSPYDPPEPYRTRYGDHLYDGEIAYADHELGRLIAWLKRQHVYDNSVIVFVSDHGESLGDHEEREHGFFIYNATTRVPLIVKPPTRSQTAPGHRRAPVETIAIGPTLTGLASVRDGISKQFQVGSLLDAPADADRGAYSETLYPFSSFGWSPLHSLETTRYHYIDAPEPELYDLQADPDEKNNLATQQPATVDVLKAKTKQRLLQNPFATAKTDSSSLSPDAAEKLRALGYVAYKSPVSPEALAAGLPDPKSKLWEFNTILQAQDAFHAGDFSGGGGLLSKVQGQDPKMYLVPFMLGEAALRQQKWPEASEQMKRCLALNPNFDQAMTGLARALISQDKISEAKTWIEEALKQNPQNYRAWYELGVASVRGDGANALTAFEKAVSIQPNFALGLRDLGALQVQQQNYREAAKHLSRAIELGFTEPKNYNFLGISYSHTNRIDAAIENYKLALKADPQMSEAHLNLAYAYQKIGRSTAARAEYEAACKLQESFCQYLPKD